MMNSKRLARIGNLALRVPLCWILLHLSGLAAAQWTTDPTPLLKGAPFTISTPSSAVAAVYLSKYVNCSQASGHIPTGGASQSLVGGIAMFTVSDLESAFTFYLCETNSSTLQTTINFTPITYDPAFLFRAVTTTVTFSNSIPASSNIELRSFADCTTGAAAFSGTLASDRTITVTMTSSVYYFFCISYTSPVTNTVVKYGVGQILVTEEVLFTPNTATKNEATSFELGGATSSGTTIIFSSTGDCRTTVFGPHTAAGAFGKTVSVLIDVARGSYWFCIQNPPNSGIYVSAGKVTILQYGITPLTLFRSRSTSMTLNFDSPNTTTVVLASTSACSAPYVLGPDVPVSGKVTWTVSTSATYYACVQKVSSSSYIQANAIQVVDPYVVLISSLPSVVGIANTVTVSPNPNTTVIFSNSVTCDSPQATVTTDSSLQAQFVMLTSVPALVTVCVTTIDGTANYSMTTLSVRKFQISYPAVLYNRTVDYTLDSAVPLSSALKFTSSTNCSGTAEVSLSSIPSSRILSQALMTVGDMHLCIQAVGVYRNVATITVHPLPVITPSVAFTNLSTQTVISNATNGVNFTIGTNCTATPLLSLTTAASGDTSTAITYPSQGNWVGCIQLPKSDATLEVLQVASLQSYTVTSTPTGVTALVPASIRFLNVPSALRAQVANTTFFLSSASGICQGVSTADINVAWFDPNSGEFSSDAFNFTTTGTFQVCLKIGAQYLYTGTLNVTSILQTSFSVSTFILNVPFTMNITAPYIPSSFTIRSGGDTCTGSVITNGTFNSSTGTSGSVRIPQLGNFSLCVASEDGSAELWNALLVVTRFTVQTTTLFQMIVNTPRTSPTLSYPLFLSSSINCNSLAYSLATALTAPSGSYYVCATDSLTNPTWTSGGTPAATVIPTYYGDVPTPVRTNVTFNVTVNGGDVLSTSSTRLCLSPDSQCNCFAGVPNFVATNTSTSAGNLRLAQVTIPTAPFTPVFICVWSGDGTAFVALAQRTPLPYMYPYSMPKGIPQDIQSGAMKVGFGAIAQDAGCSVFLSNFAPISQYVAVNVTVPADVTDVSGYYCESTVGSSSGQWTNQGNMTLLGTFQPNVTDPSGGGGGNGGSSSSGGGGQGSGSGSGGGSGSDSSGSDSSGGSDGGTVTVVKGRIIASPATPFNLSIDPNAGSKPFVSTTEDCSNYLDIRFGVYPSESGQRLFYICVLSPDGSVNYTNPVPNLQILDFRLLPQGLLTDDPTLLRLSPSVKLVTTTYALSRSENCGSMFSTTTFGTNLTLSSSAATTNTGKHFMCVNVLGTFVGIISFGVFRAPAPLNVTVPALGLPTCHFVVLRWRDYSLTPGADSAYALQPYYVQNSRNFYLSTDRTRCSNVSTPDATATFVSTVNSTATMWRVCVSTQAPYVVPMVPYALCASTPVRNASITEVTFEAATFVPSIHVTGVPSPVSVALLPLTTFAIYSAADANCATQISDPFETDAEGAGTLIASNAATQAALTPGRYRVCAFDSLDGRWHSVGTITVASQQQFSLSTTHLVVGTPTEVMLQGDLRAAAVFGFSDDGSCDNTTAYDTGMATLVVVNATVLRVTGKFVGYTTLCVQAAINNTVIPLTLIDFVSSPIAYPGSAPACQDFTVGFNDATEAAAGSSVFLYADSCCLSVNPRGQNPKLILSTAVTLPISVNLRSLSVTADQLAAFSPLSAFHLCLTNTSVCLDLGTILFTDTSSCGNTLIPSTPSPRGDLVLVGGAPLASGLRKSDLIWLLLAFLILALLLAVVVVIYVKYRGRKVVPADVNVPPNEDPLHERELHGWKKAFDRMFVGGDVTVGPEAKGMLYVPVDMNLEVCRELPLQLQEMQTTENEERGQIEADERFCREHLWLAFESEYAAALEAGALAEREQFLRDMEDLFFQQLGEVENEEVNARLSCIMEEEAEMLAIAEAERAAWRIRMEAERSKLDDPMSIDWRSRTRRLQEGSSRMLNHLDAGGALGNGAAKQYLTNKRSFQFVDTSATHNSRYADVELDLSYVPGSELHPPGVSPINQSRHDVRLQEAMADMDSVGGGPGRISPSSRRGSKARR